VQLVARVDEHVQAFIQGLIILPHLREPAPIIWIVDTGCTETCLLHDDVVRLQIDWRACLQKDHPVITANGEVYPRIQNNLEIWFRGKTGPFNLFDVDIGKKYETMDIMCPLNDEYYSRGTLSLPTSYSLLGMDFLSAFKKWVWKDERLILHS